jgi:DNA-binding NarL/FixJ family response regulator
MTERGDTLTMSNFRTLVIEDDAFTRTSISGALTNAQVDVVATARSAKAAVEEFEKHNPDVIVADLDLGFGPTGIDLARTFRIRKPTLGVVMLTSYSDPRLLRNNIPDLPPGCEYLVKNQVHEIDVVANAIARSVASAKSGMLVSKSSGLPSAIHGLTEIQIETLRLVSEGLTNSEIAKQRFVSEKAVEQTIAKIAKALSIPQATNQNQRVHIARVYFRLSGQAR